MNNDIQDKCDFGLVLYNRNGINDKKVNRCYNKTLHYDSIIDYDPGNGESVYGNPEIYTVHDKTILENLKSYYDKKYKKKK